MFGNKFSGDNIAKEFFKIKAMKKMASGGDETISLDYENHVEDEVVDPADFLQSLNKVEETSEMEVEDKISDLDSWADDVHQVDSAKDFEVDFLIDSKAEETLNGLGKIAGSLRAKGENFASDVVEATALSIKDDLMKEAKAKLEAITVLSKIASDISEHGDRFTADIVEATINKIKNS